MQLQNRQRTLRKIQHILPSDFSLLRVAAYCRVSSDSTDQLHSYAAQIKYYTEMIDRNPDWELTDIYADEGLSGTKTDKREDLNRLVADCRRGKIDRVLVKSVSRFARNTYDSLALARMFKGFGVGIYFEEQDIDTEKMSDEFIYTMQSMAAQGESIAISQNMRWHYQDVMKSGDYVGTISAYGYKLVNRTLEVYEPEARVVRRIFSMYFSGMGTLAIADILNRENAPRRHGYTTWYPNTVLYILNNERYVGDALLQKTYTTEFPFRKLINKGEMPQYYVENSHPPLISKEDFEAAQAIQANRRKAYTPRGNHPLNGKLYCPDCGHTFRKMMINNISYWQCCYHVCGKSVCRGDRFSEEAVCDTFMLLINKLISYRTQVLTPMLADLERMQNRVSVVGGKVYEIDKQIAILNTKIHTFTQHRTSGIMDAAYFTAQTAEVKGRICTLRTERCKLLAEDEHEEMLDELRELEHIIAETQCQADFDGELFQQIVRRITVTSSMELQFRLVGGLELKETIHYKKRR